MKDFLKNACLYRQAQGRRIIFGIFSKERKFWLSYVSRFAFYFRFAFSM